METQVTLIKNDASTLYIDHPNASYGNFCFNSKGDLFLNSDWGTYGYAWRAFGDDFVKFIGNSNPDYIVGKFEINYRELTQKKLPKFREEKVLILVAELIKYCKEISK